MATITQIGCSVCICTTGTPMVIKRIIIQNKSIGLTFPYSENCLLTKYVPDKITNRNWAFDYSINLRTYLITECKNILFKKKNLLLFFHF